jgi:hypothetical protein
MGEIAGFVNDLSAQMAGMKTDDHCRAHNDALRQLDRMREAVAQTEVASIEDYKEAMKLKSAISSLFCYAFNNNLPEWEEVCDLEGELGKKLYGFARTYDRIKDKETRAVAKYFITNPR